MNPQLSCSLTALLSSCACKKSTVTSLLVEGYAYFLHTTLKSPITAKSCLLHGYTTNWSPNFAVHAQLRRHLASSASRFHRVSEFR